MCAVLLFHSSRNGLTVFYLKQKSPCLGTLVGHGFQWLTAVLRRCFLLRTEHQYPLICMNWKRLLTFPLVAGMVCWEQLWATRLFSLANNMVYRGKFSGDYVGFGWLLSVPPYFELMWFTDASEMSFRLILVLYPGLRAHKLNDRALLTSFHQTWPPSESEFSLKMV